MKVLGGWSSASWIAGAGIALMMLAGGVLWLRAVAWMVKEEDEMEDCA